MMNRCHPLEALGPARQSLAGSREPFLPGINEDLILTGKMNTNYKEADHVHLQSGVFMGVRRDGKQPLQLSHIIDVKERKDRNTDSPVKNLLFNVFLFLF